MDYPSWVEMIADVEAPPGIARRGDRHFEQSDAEAAGRGCPGARDGCRVGHAHGRTNSRGEGGGDQDGDGDVADPVGRPYVRPPRQRIAHRYATECVIVPE